jgi:hypothetical protein
MNKKVYVSFFLVAFLSFSSLAFSATYSNTADGNGAGTTIAVDGDQALTFTFSPSVAGQYATTATSGNEQWYSVATFHAGGTRFFGSASDQTSVYKRNFEGLTITGTSPTFADADVPEASVDADGDGTPDAWADADLAEGESDWYR